MNTAIRVLVRVLIFAVFLQFALPGEAQNNKALPVTRSSRQRGTGPSWATAGEEDRPSCKFAEQRGFPDLRRRSTAADSRVEPEQLPLSVVLLFDLTASV